MKIRFFRLHGVLRQLDVLKAFQKGDWDQLKENEEAFAELIKNEPDDAKITALLKILIESYVANLKPSEATAAQGQRVEALVENTYQATYRHIDARNSDDATFEPNLQMLNRFRAEEARNIRSIWPNVSRAVAEIVVSPDRKQTVAAWAEQRPTWMQDLPIASMCWLGSLARDYGARTTATGFYAEAISNGAVPRSYWKAKRAMAAGPVDKVSLQEQLAGDAPHPLSNALLSAVDGDAGGMREHLQNWETGPSEDDCLRKLLLVDALDALGDHDEAITVAKAAADLYGTGSAHLTAAQRLLARGTARSQPNYLGDLQEGLRHALSARETYRKWQGDSPEAALTTMRAYSLLGDYLSGWKAMQPPPEGTATEREASDETVRTESCMLSAELGMMSRARDLLASVKDPGTIAHVKALMAESEGDTEEANRNWTEAFRHAPDPGLGLSIATRLARKGLEIPVPAWENLASPEISDLRLISDVFRKIDGSLQLARSRQLESRHVLASLINFHAEQGNITEAAATAELGAKRWHDPELWLTAAGFHHELDHNTEASRCAENSLHAGGSIWRRRTEAYRVLIEAKSAAGDILEAAEYAAQLFTEQPDDPGTQWALIKAQYLGADVEGAWDTYKNRANEPQPRSNEEVLIWLRLNRQFGNPFDINRALDLAEQRDDEEVRANILLSIMLSDTPSRSESTQQRFTAAYEKFRENFPASEFMEPHEINPDDLLGSFDQLMERLPDYTEQLDQINAGLLPVGMASTMRNRSYAELIISGGAGVIYGGDPSSLETELGNLENIHTAVLDTTAMHSLVLLDNETSRILLGTFSSTRTTIEQYRDVLAATDSTTFSSELAVYKDPVTGRARLSQTPAEVLEINRARSKSLLEMFKTTQRVSNPKLLRAPEDHRLLPWLSAADLAERQGLIFWCDDRVLRSIAAASGVKTVGTVAVLEMAREGGLLDPDLVDVAEAVLVQNRYVGITFNPKVYRLAAEMSVWRPQGVAAAVMKHGPTDPDELANFVLNAIRQVLHAPDDVRDWVSAFAQWLVSVTGEPNRATEALIHWLRQLSDQDWMTPDLMVFASEGVRSAANKLEGVTDPLPQAMNLLYEDLVKRTDESLAAQFLTGLVSRMNSEDRGAVLRNILMS
ncbi:hypothetical protein [Arthrobacter sp. UYCu712]|uniref:PIN domain-containing protein n=1 Tax=Arthrobacter sp. UYCu712 TaxID=3156340 RepID=UPI0033966C5B